MKLFKSTRKEKNKPGYFVDKNIRSGNVQSAYSGQTKESQILLGRIHNRRRNAYSSRVVFRKKHGLVKKLVFLVVTISVVAFLIIKFDAVSYFEVDFVSVEGSGSFVSIEDVKALIESSVIGKSIFSINENDIIDVLTKTFLGAKSVSVNKEYPNEIKIFIQERVPLAIVQNSSGDNFLIDSDGYVLGLVAEKFSDLPKIQYEGPVIVGTFLEKEMIPISIELLQFADQEGLKISSMSFSPNYVRAFVGNGAEVFIGYDKDRDKSLKTVGALIKQSESDGKMLRKIDLRYDKVIVLYE
jgi:cell division septal protein FtsQ